MKKSFLLVFIGAASSLVASYGQGLILFGNYYSSTQTTGIFYGTGPAAGLGVGPEISVTLLYGMSTATDISQLTPLIYNDGHGDTSPVAAGNGYALGPGPVPASNGAGWFYGGAVLIPGTAGSTYAFALEATGIYEGSTYIGFSSIFTGFTQAGVTYPVPTLPEGLLKGSFYVVPEPSTLALAGMCASGIFMVLRLKKA